MNPDLLITVFFCGQLVVLAAAAIILIARETLSARRTATATDRHRRRPQTEVET